MRGEQEAILDRPTGGRKPRINELPASILIFFAIKKYEISLLSEMLLSNLLFDNYVM
jgi:hypothetical protein